MENDFLLAMHLAVSYAAIVITGSEPFVPSLGFSCSCWSWKYLISLANILRIRD